MQGSCYTDDVRDRVALTYLITGNGRETSRICDVPAMTVIDWKNSDWFQAKLVQLRAEKADELDAKMSGFIHLAMEQAIDRVTNGDWIVNAQTGETVRKPMSGKDLVVAMAVCYDKRALQRGDPTSRTERVGTDELLDKLARKMELMAQRGALTAERTDSGTNDE